MSHSVSRVRAYPNDGSVRRDPVVLQATDMASMMDTATKSLGLPWSARRIFTITGREVPHQHCTVHTHSKVKLSDGRSVAACILTAESS